MVKLIDRYLIKAIISTSLLVLFGLMAIDFLAQVFGNIDDVNKNDFTFIKLLTFIALQVPIRLIDFFPISLLIGSLMGLGKLAANNELTVFQLIGVSRLRISIIGFVVSVIMGAIVISITEFVGAYSYSYAQYMRSEALGEINSKGLVHGSLWVQDNNQFVHISGVAGDGDLVGVDIYFFDDQMHIQKVISADRVKFVQDNWRLINSTEKIITPTEIVVNFKEVNYWKNNIQKSVLAMLIADPTDLSLRDLRKFIDYQRNNNIKATTFLLVFWQRLFLPLTAGVMFLLALPFVFGSQRNSSQGRKLFVGILLGLTYYICYSSIANLTLLIGIPVIFGAIFPILLFASIGLIMLRFRR